jgi:hypothetical protein
MTMTDDYQTAHQDFVRNAWRNGSPASLALGPLEREDPLPPVEPLDDADRAALLELMGGRGGRRDSREDSRAVRFSADEVDERMDEHGPSCGKICQCRAKGGCQAIPADESARMIVQSAEDFHEAHGSTRWAGRRDGIMWLRDRGRHDDADAVERGERSDDAWPDTQAAAIKSRQDARDAWKLQGEIAAPAREREDASTSESEHEREADAAWPDLEAAAERSRNDAREAWRH